MARWHVKMRIGKLLARWHVNHAGMQARWHVDQADMQARMARDLANSAYNKRSKTLLD